MKRRTLLKAAAALALLPGTRARRAGAQGAPSGGRVRPGEPGWPAEDAWARLGDATGGRLIKVTSPLAPCRDAPGGFACRDLFRELKNPYYIGDQVGLSETTGWIDAWTFEPSVYAVAAQGTADVVAAVDFARTQNLRLVVKGGGHSYLGTSNVRDSLLIWTRAMNGITLHDGFVAAGCAGCAAPQPAVTVGAGAIWMHAYNAVTTAGGRYVQGGGCGTVGVAGLVQGGGFGTYSKTYGSAAASLLEAEVVTADGVARIANAETHPDLFWALKGGGGGSFGVVTRLTLRTHALPELFGIVHTTIAAADDAAFRRLVGRFIGFYAAALFNPHWGEIVTLRPGNRLEIRMEFQGLDQDEAAAIWRPFLDWVSAAGVELTFPEAPLIRSFPARRRWDPAFIRANAPGAILPDDRPGAPGDNIFWSGNLSETGHFLYGFESAWLPAALLASDRQESLADALAAAGRISAVELHFQKGLAGGSEAARAATRETSTSPALLDAFVLAIIAGEGPPAYPGLAGHEPNLRFARRRAGEIRRAMAILKEVAPDPGAYVAESSFFEERWQEAYWGAHYPRLRAIKQKYDPDGLFFAHHGVGSEDWSPDGFRRMAGP
jgi:FAD/FMN-containing dehydrogenase